MAPSSTAYRRAGRPPDPAFADPRLAELYDVLDDDRSDLNAYVALADEVEARRVLDIGCGTGSLAVLLAARGLGVAGLVEVRDAPDRPRLEHVVLARRT